ncbi:MAG: tyrosine--tRNA ligase, partial [Candidatus Sacchiramonaceae bacterium]|nr:tyrosine--tRNA ligase [Candidatus Saccharimonadaceae bacterium]
LLQGYDFWHLHRNHGVNLQIGGSDQWGNLLSGVELTRKKEGAEVYAMTSPLVINKSTGRKFGKSEGGAVWLDPAQTSPYKFYQFWLNSDDESAIDYLKLFTLLGREEIEQIESEHQTNLSGRLAQKTLAFEVTKLVHGEDVAKNVITATEVLFGGASVEDLSDDEIEILASEIPAIDYSGEKSISDALLEAELVKSKGEARRLIAGNAISVNNQKIAEDQPVQSKSLIKKGKNSFILVK